VPAAFLRRDQNQRQKHCRALADDGLPGEVDPATLVKALRRLEGSARKLTALCGDASDQTQSSEDPDHQACPSHQHNGAASSASQSHPGCAVPLGD
jgi:hypothetical protein